MTEERIVRAGRAIVVHDAAVAERDVLCLFDGAYVERETRRLDERTGRGGVRIVDRGDERWVLRHYHRGGAVSRFVDDHYLWLGLDRARSFREWRLLARLAELGLPAPRPVAARVVRSGLAYRADIVTRYLPDTRPLSAFLDEGVPLDGLWREIGRMVRAFHDHGVQHPDLTAHNILLDPSGRTFLVDFDNARLRAPGSWREAGLARLERSLRKVALETGGTFDERGWRELEAGYRGA
ncbi:MAG TPA: 3-deoxy-D-manno-octulosonic acid kinase [Gammaproteobacteria bacterium]